MTHIERITESKVCLIFQLIDNHNDLVANCIMNLSRSSLDKQATKFIKSHLRHLKNISTEISTKAAPFTLEEINESILKIKTGKVVGIDKIYPEFIKHTEPRTRVWLT